MDVFSHRQNCLPKEAPRHGIAEPAGSSVSNRSEEVASSRSKETPVFGHGWYSATKQVRLEKQRTLRLTASSKKSRPGRPGRHNLQPDRKGGPALHSSPTMRGQTLLSEVEPQRELHTTLLAGRGSPAEIAIRLLALGVELRRVVHCVKLGMIERVVELTILV
jgi:hypothetical protein